MSIRILIPVAVFAYFLGSIPFGYILVRLFTGSDVRAQGSGNIGATNVARTGKKGLAIATLALDALKGYLAVYIVREFGVSIFNYGLNRYLLDVELLAALAALFAIIGHMFPVWLRFKGGKGVATGMGVFLALAPQAVLVVLMVFLLVFAVTRYVSLGSIVAAALFPLIMLWLERARMTPAVFAMSATCAFLIIYRHKQNIARLMAGTESRFGSAKAESTKPSA